MRKQSRIPWINKDYSDIDFYRKAHDYNHDPVSKEIFFNGLRDAEIRREYHMGSIKQINQAIQLDRKPNRRLKEPQCEVYKITITFSPISMTIFII